MLHPVSTAVMAAWSMPRSPITTIRDSRGSSVRHGRSQSTMIVVRPLTPHDHYVVLTIDPPDAP